MRQPSDAVQAPRDHAQSVRGARLKTGRTWTYHPPFALAASGRRAAGAAIRLRLQATRRGRKRRRIRPPALHFMARAADVPPAAPCIQPLKEIA